MGENSKIEWCDHTVNYWAGCTEVSNGPKGACPNCYARDLAKFHGWAEWGNHPRHKFIGALPLVKKLQRSAAKRGVKEFVFSNSLADIMDNQVPIEWLAEAVDAAAESPNLIHLWLTKRPQNFIPRLEATGLPIPPNVAFLCTVVTQAEADRDLPHLFEAGSRFRPAFLGVSMEPLMEAVDIAWALSRNPIEIGAGILRRGHFSPGLETIRRLGWVIAGGESGRHARPSDPAWFRRLRDQCEAANVPFMFKQWGEWSTYPPEEIQALAATSTSRYPVSASTGLVKIGKKRAGRALDGVVHDARPVVTLATA